MVGDLKAPTIGTRILAARELRNMTQHGLALLVDVSVRSVINWEEGKFFPDEEVRSLIAEVLDAPRAWLFSGIERHVVTDLARVEAFEDELALFWQSCRRAQESWDAEEKARIAEEQRLRAERESRQHSLKGTAPTKALDVLAEKRRRDKLSPDEREEEDFQRAFLRGLELRGRWT